MDAIIVIEDTLDAFRYTLARGGIQLTYPEEQLRFPAARSWFPDRATELPLYFEQLAHHRRLGRIPYDPVPTNEYRTARAVFLAHGIYLRDVLRLLYRALYFTFRVWREGHLTDFNLREYAVRLLWSREAIEDHYGREHGQAEEFVADPLFLSVLPALEAQEREGDWLSLDGDVRNLGWSTEWARTLDPWRHAG